LVAIDMGAGWVLGRSRRILAEAFAGVLMRSNAHWTAVILFYLLFVFVGLLVFVIVPSLNKTGSTKKVLVLGALFGHEKKKKSRTPTYALTTLATLKNWPWVSVTVGDLLWGCNPCHWGQLHMDSWLAVGLRGDRLKSPIWGNAIVVTPHSRL
jgi:uncharacterized membrane protein